MCCTALLPSVKDSKKEIFHEIIPNIDSLNMANRCYLSFVGGGAQLR